MCLLEFPSGGLDSSSVAFSVSRQGMASGVSSFTVRVREKGYDEGPLAARVARMSGMHHHELSVRQDELLPSLRRATWHNDEPLAHSSSLHILAIAAYAKPHVTVLLSGEGSDEILGGYVRYFPLRFPGLLKRAIENETLLGGLGRIHPRLGKLVQFAGGGRSRGL